MPRGRPRGTGEVARARAEMEAERQKLREQVSKLTNKKDPFPYAFEAACVLYTLERGTRYQRANCHWRILDLRKLAQKNGPTGILRDDVSFLNAFIARHAPGWNWREQIGDGELARQNERIVKEQVWLERKEKARRSKFVTPDDPDRGVLLSFLTIRSSDPATWPSLRDLKLATAIGERTLAPMIAKLKPTKDEIVKKGVRPTWRRIYGKRGALPKRFGPRIVREIVRELLRRLPTYPIDDEEREQIQGTVTRLLRSLGQTCRASR